MIDHGSRKTLCTSIYTNYARSWHHHMGPPTPSLVGSLGLARTTHFKFDEHNVETLVTLACPPPLGKCRDLGMGVDGNNNKGYPTNSIKNDMIGYLDASTVQPKNTFLSDHKVVPLNDPRSTQWTRSGAQGCLFALHDKCI
jgi:hypothetical protein